MLVSRQEDWLSAQVGDDELVMMSVENGKYLGLSKVGARVWELIETPRDLDEILGILLDEFEVTPQKCREEVDAFLQELATHGAVRLGPLPR